MPSAQLTRESRKQAGNPSPANGSNAQLLSNATTIFAIFFAGWWGLLATMIFGLLDGHPLSGTADALFLQWGYVVASVMYPLAFTLCFSRWLWQLSDTIRPQMTLSDLVHASVLRTTGQVLLLILAVLSGGLVMWHFYAMPLGLALLGGLLHLVWCVVSLILVVTQALDEEQAPRMPRKELR